MKMAAACSTFRGLLLLRGFVPVRVAAVLPRRGYGARVPESGELVTHTGQVYEENDYRKVRFVTRQKEVAKNYTGDEPKTAELVCAFKDQLFYIAFNKCSSSAF